MCAMKVVELEVWCFSYHLKKSWKGAGGPKLSKGLVLELGGTGVALVATTIDQGGQPCMAKYLVFSSLWQWLNLRQPLSTLWGKLQPSFWGTSV